MSSKRRSPTDGPPRKLPRLEAKAVGAPAGATSVVVVTPIRKKHTFVPTKVNLARLARMNAAKARLVEEARLAKQAWLNQLDRLAQLASAAANMASSAASSAMSSATSSAAASAASSVAASASGKRSGYTPVIAPYCVVEYLCTGVRPSSETDVLKTKRALNFVLGRFRLNATLGVACIGGLKHSFKLSYDQLDWLVKMLNNLNTI